MSLIPQINRYDDFNYNEDFEESIAKTMDSCSEEGSTFSHLHEEFSSFSFLFYDFVALILCFSLSRF
jgi:hypothetical protein